MNLEFEYEFEINTFNIKMNKLFQNEKKAKETQQTISLLFTFFSVAVGCSIGFYGITGWIGFLIYCLASFLWTVFISWKYKNNNDMPSLLNLYFKYI